MTLAHAHRVADEVEAALLQAFPHTEVMIHQDPAGDRGAAAILSGGLASAALTV